MHILIIEDDEIIAKNIKTYLKNKGFISTIAANIVDGTYCLQIDSYDVVVLDWMLPDGSGLDFCKTLREKNIAVPIIMLTAKSQLEDKVEGLIHGADDYLTKPFALEELHARVKALARRSTQNNPSHIINIGDLVIDTNTTKVMRNNHEIILAPKEYALLEYLVMHKCKVIDRMTLLHHVWGEDINPFSNTIDVHVRYLRRKIDDPYKKKLLQTVKNKGYMICQS